MILLNDDQSRIVDYIKQHIQAVLRELDDFYPFGVDIKTDGTLVPLAASLDEDNLSVQSLIASIEQLIADGLIEKSTRLSAIAIAITIPEFGENLDGVQIRFYAPGEEPDFLNLRYRKIVGGIEFF